MKPVLKKLLLLTTFITVGQTLANTVTPTLAYRSQGFHGDRQRNVGVVEYINLADSDPWYKNTDVAIGYMRSFRNDKITRCLFGDDLVCNDCCENTILVQGSQVADRNAKAWLADYFYLNCEYDGSFCITPRIQNVVIDLDFYLGLDEWLEGSYLRIYGPINWSKWETNLCVSNPENISTVSCSAGYLTASGTEVLLDDLAKYFQGGTAGAPAMVDSRTVFQPLRFAKMGNCDETKTGFADLRVELGWNFLQHEDYHLGAALHMATPTGTKRRAEFVMEPTIGNGHHWELGGAIHGHYVFWNSENEDQHLGFYVDAVLTHIFKGKEQRTFDLKCKDNSRYMLAMKFSNQSIYPVFQLMGNPYSGEATGEPPQGIVASKQFDNLYAPVANLTTSPVDVSIAIQADISAMFNYNFGNFSWDVGYNFWGRTCEHISCPMPKCDPCNPDNIFLIENQNCWALKGDARAFGFFGPQSFLDAGEPVPLSATQRNATIHSGTNATTTNPSPSLTDIALQNGGVDNGVFPYALQNDNSGNDGILVHTPLSQGGFNDASNQIKTSIQPIFINPQDIALQETRGISHTIFTHLSYNWEGDTRDSYLGMGGSAEFGKNESTPCDTDCETISCDPCKCIDCSLTQWAIWIKGGVSFN